MFGKKTAPTLAQRMTEMRPTEAGWTVQIAPAQAYRTRERLNPYDMYRNDEYKLIPIQGRVAVRLCLKGKSQMTFGTVEINDDEFDDKITTLKAAAEEKCGTLNAIGCEAV